ncbi:MAG: type III-B CRISPR module RAMP protein Cmr4 [Candidatus Eisenbacteria bacterium]|nr:type III-B CRISPR module RAMP protein Cmr4 [Candidatus Eisenbacteria bacterium]
MTVCTFFIHALSPLHPGVGAGVGSVDLPVAREVTTMLPLQYGSGIKGVLRAKYDDGSNEARAVFGPDTDKSDEHAGAVSFSDAKLLCLPVRSICGTFAWTTSPILLHRFSRDFPTVPWHPIVLGEHQAHVNESDCALVGAGSASGKLHLEDLDLEIRPDNREQAASWASSIAKAVFPGDAGWQSEFCRRFAILSDDVFAFLYETALEVRARTRIEDDLKVVKEGALWYEELIPAESILWGVALAERSFKKVDALKGPAEILNFAFTGKAEDAKQKECEVQLGGKATVGCGRARLVRM